MTRLVVLLFFFTLPAIAQNWTPFGNFTQSTTYSTTVQPPINADGSSVWPAKKAGVVPVKFSLATGLGDVVIASTAVYPDPKSFGGVSSTPSNLFLDDNFTDLQFNGSVVGICGGGSPRWQLVVPDGTQGCNAAAVGGQCNVFVYITAPATDLTPPTTDYTDSQCGTYASGLNVMAQTDARFEMNWHPTGVQYYTLSDLKTYLGAVPIQEIDFVVDGFSSVGSQQATLHSITINNDTVLLGSASPTPTCNLPPATIDVQQVSGATLLPVSESVYTMPADNGADFRINSCQYVYNLSTKQLAAGQYKVFANINNGGDVATGGQFALQ